MTGLRFITCFNPDTHINVTGEITAEEVIANGVVSKDNALAIIGEKIIDFVPAGSSSVKVLEEVLVIVVFLYLITR